MNTQEVKGTLAKLLATENLTVEHRKVSTACFDVEKRLLILCRLAMGEATVSELCEVTDLSQSAMSQHLAKMRAEDLVKGRKDGLQVHYSIADPRCVGILHHLKSQFCTAAEALEGKA